MWCDALSSDWVWHLALSYSLPYCSVPLLPLCLLLQHCWFSAVSLWQGVSLWNRGDGCVLGGRACDVYCLHIIRVVVRISVACML